MREETYLSVLENGLVDAGEGALGLAAEPDDVVAEMFFLIAPMAAVPAAVALVFNTFALELSAAPAPVAQDGVVRDLVVGAVGVQLWLTGKRWAGQNCSLHFYRCSCQYAFRKESSRTHITTNGCNENLAAVSSRTHRR